MDVFWRGQLEIAHNFDKFLAAFAITQARIVSHFFSNRGAAAPLIVMSGIDDGIARQDEQLLYD